MQLSKAIEGFILDAKAGRYSASYVPTVKFQMEYICKFFGDPELESLTPEHWKKFLAHLHTEYQPKRFNKSTAPLSPASIDNYWKIIHGFYNWTVDAGLLLGSTRADVKLPRPKFESPQIIPFTMDEVKKLLEACQYTKVKKTNGQTYRIQRPNADRDKAIMLIFLDTGIRLGELSRLRLGDVNLETGEVFIRPFATSRKSKSRVVFLGQRTRQIVWRYIAKQQSNADLSLPLFDLKYSSIRLLIKKIGKNAGVAAHPHKFRHTFCVTYLKNGGDIITLQRLMGHSTLDMVKHYLYLVKSDLAEVHKRASPVDIWKL